MLSSLHPRRLLLDAALLAAAAALSGGALAAQYFNRAVWLGFDDDGVRRDFRQGTEYFLDRLSYVVAPPWADPELRSFDPGVRYALGSVTSSEFTFEGRIDDRRELGDGVAFHYHVLQGEHRDARFLHTALGLEYALDEHRALFAQGTPFADKSLIDLSLGAVLWRDGASEVRAMLTMVDFANDKSRAVDYERDAYGLHVAGAVGDARALRVAFDLGTQLPMRARRLDDDATFDLQRSIASVQAGHPLGDRDRLLVAIESESTDKALAPATPGDPLEESFRREFHQLRAEWWRDQEHAWSLGCVHTYHSERGRRPNDPTGDLRTLRREWLAVGRLRLPLSDRLTFEPQLFAGHVEDRFADGGDRRDRSRFEGKVAWNARWQFSPMASLVLIVSTQLDELAFGGGGAQFVARF